METRTYTIGRFLLVLTQVTAGWRASLDGVTLDGHFPTQAEAWAAGVREADGRDRMDLWLQRLLTTVGNYNQPRCRTSPPRDTRRSC
jgi:hypothetical protein